MKMPLIKPALNAALDLAMPPQDLLSGHLAPSGIDGVLWGDIRFLDDPACWICGFPFDFDQGKGALCGRCAARPPAFDHARAAFQYDDHSRKLVLNFKHGGRTQGLKTFAVHMARAGRTLIDDADYLMPVPLHPSRLIKRRYNQSAILTRALKKHTSARYDPDSLYRTRATPSQGGQTVSGRRRNVSGAFRVRPAARQRLAGTHIVLIDDVMTTGATLESCARTLKRAGVARVDALTLARVVRASPLPT